MRTMGSPKGSQHALRQGVKRPDSRRAARRRALGEGDALDGEEFLGVDGLVEGHEVVLEVGDFLEVFEAYDGVTGGGESVFAGVLGEAGLAFRGTGAGRLGGIGAIGGELLRGDGVLGIRHAVILPLSELARGGASV